jgi:hypothetical protein
MTAAKLSIAASLKNIIIPRKISDGDYTIRIGKSKFSVFFQG